MRGGAGLQLGAALMGRFEDEVAEGRANVVAALGLAIADVAAELVSKLRQDVAASGLANAAALQKVWSVRYYGTGRSLSPAAWVYSRFPIIQRAFEDAPTIAARNGKFLLMPNPDVWPAGRVRRPRARSGGAMSSSLEAARRRFGPLQFIPLKSGNAVLVAQVRESAARPGTFRKASASALTRMAAGKASGLSTVVVFFLVKAARLPRLLRGEIIRRRTDASFGGDMERAFARRFTSYTADGPRQLTGPARAPAREAAAGDGGWGDWTRT